MYSDVPRWIRNIFVVSHKFRMDEFKFNQWTIWILVVVVVSRLQYIEQMTSYLLDVLILFSISSVSVAIHSDKMRSQNSFHSLFFAWVFDSISCKFCFFFFKSIHGNFIKICWITFGVSISLYWTCSCFAEKPFVYFNHFKPFRCFQLNRTNKTKRNQHNKTERSICISFFHCCGHSKKKPNLLPVKCQIWPRDLTWTVTKQNKNKTKAK